MSTCERPPGDSREQREAERVICEQLEKDLGVKLACGQCVHKLRPDGFVEEEEPILVEVWAHQGTAKSAQKAKMMSDMCKLLLLEKRLGKSCRKIVAVSDCDARSFLNKSWQGQFARAFGIEVLVVNIPAEVRERLRKAQKRQYR